MARIPTLDGATGWINSPPLRPDELRGHVVLVNFWTLTCINWLRTVPHIREWSRAYRDNGLVVVGVHTPEFAFEHQIELVNQAVRAREIDYPVALDNDYAVWNAFDNHYWPAVYLLDEKGTRRGQHFGEGSYEQVERAIQRLLGVERPLVTAHGTGVEAEADWRHLRSPETYLGGARTTNFTPTDGSAIDEQATSRFCPSTTGLWPATGPSTRSTCCSSGQADRSPTGSWLETHTWCCPRPTRSRFPSGCSSTVPGPDRTTASTSTRAAPACFVKAGCTSSSEPATTCASARWKSPSPGQASGHTSSRSGRRPRQTRGNPEMTEPLPSCASWHPSCGLILPWWS